MLISILDIDIIYQVKEEYFKLQIVFSNEINDEYHYTFLKKLPVEKTSPEQQINMMIILFDSLSRSHAERSLKKTFKHLSEHPRTVVMKVSLITCVNLNPLQGGMSKFTHFSEKLT